MSESLAHPQIASREDWLAARLQLLAEEKRHTREYDRINALRRRLPMVKIEKTYTFETPEGPATLRDAFEDKSQLIVYHFMFDPAWEKGCPGCTGFVDSLGDLSLLAKRDTTFALVSRAPQSKLTDYKALRGWSVPWYSAFGSDFNYDFDVTADATVKTPMYNFQADPKGNGESHGMSVFFRIGEDVFHTYSTYARGVEDRVDTYRMLDMTPYGRQEDFEDSPPGWPQRPTYG